nr:hypothetical protein [Actinomyces ruminis]
MSRASLFRSLARCAGHDWRTGIQAACLWHVTGRGDLSLCLYDVTTLYFEVEKEDDLRRVGYSKERRVDPQVIVGLLVDRAGFPLRVGCWEATRPRPGACQCVCVSGLGHRWGLIRSG